MGVSRSTGGLHARLKHETRAEHAALEQAVAERRYFETVPGYVQWLRRFFAFQSEAEAQLSAFHAGSVIRDWPARRRAHLASADLKSLGVADQWLTTRADFEREHQQTEPHDHDARPAHILGVAYVLEGATLGGAVLLKSVASLGISAERGGSFLASYGASRGAMWQRFLNTLDDWDARVVPHDDVVLAASATFAAARFHLTAEETPRPDITSTAREPLRSSL